MAEYIEREAAVSNLELLARHEDRFRQSVILGVVDAIRAMEAADVAPVVHCRHCRSYNKPWLGWCSVHLDREGPDDFCGYGARMDGGACNQVCKYNTPDRGCVAGELRARCDLANVAGERGNGEAG